MTRLLPLEIGDMDPERLQDPQYTQYAFREMVQAIRALQTDSGIAESEAATPGVTVHGDLSGLAADDHTQYHNDTRGDVRYYTKSEHSVSGQPSKPIILDTDGKLSHLIIDDGDIDHGLISGLGDDDHTQYYNETRGDTRYRLKNDYNVFLNTTTGPHNTYIGPSLGGSIDYGTSTVCDISFTAYGIDNPSGSEWRSISVSGYIETDKPDATPQTFVNWGITSLTVFTNSSGVTFPSFSSDDGWVGATLGTGVTVASFSGFELSLRDGPTAGSLDGIPELNINLPTASSGDVAIRWSVTRR